MLSPSPLAALFARRAATAERPHVRLVRLNDERRILQISERAVITQFELSGRPDGLRPGGHESYLDFLQARGAASGVKPRFSPQEWMELDREFTQFALRRKAALAAGSEAHVQHDATTALSLYRLAARDAQHEQDIITLTTQAHPRGGMSAARKEALPALAAQRCLAESAMCVLTDDYAGAVACVRAGIQQVTSLLRTAGEGDPESNACIRELRELEIAIRSAGEVVQESPLGISIPSHAVRPR